MNQLTENLINHIDMTINLEGHLKVVLIDTTAKDLAHIDNHSHNANIYCIDKSYNILWQVDSDSGLMERDAFVYMEKFENKLEANRFFGNKYSIDLKTGKSEHTGWNK